MYMYAILDTVICWRNRKKRELSTSRVYMYWHCKGRNVRFPLPRCTCMWFCHCNIGEMWRNVIFPLPGCTLWFLAIVIHWRNRKKRELITPRCKSKWFSHIVVWYAYIGGIKEMQAFHSHSLPGCVYMDVILAIVLDEWKKPELSTPRANVYVILGIKMACNNGKEHELSSSGCTCTKFCSQ